MLEPYDYPILTTQREIDKVVADAVDKVLDKVIEAAHEAGVPLYLESFNNIWRKRSESNVRD